VSVLVTGSAAVEGVNTGGLGCASFACGGDGEQGEGACSRRGGPGMHGVLHDVEQRLKRCSTFDHEPGESLMRVHARGSRVTQRHIAI
jgi:hypothetical protein